MQCRIAFWKHFHSLQSSKLARCLYSLLDFTFNLKNLEKGCQLWTSLTETSYEKYKVTKFWNIENNMSKLLEKKIQNKKLIYLFSSRRNFNGVSRLFKRVHSFSISIFSFRVFEQSMGLDMNENPLMMIKNRFMSNKLICIWLKTWITWSENN